MQFLPEIFDRLGLDPADFVSGPDDLAGAKALFAAAAGPRQLPDPLQASPALANPFDRVLRGELEGAKYAVAVPRGEWSGKLLLHAHGHRAVGEGLVADLDPAEPQFRALLEDGWAVGMTSYRREGVIVADAMLDIDNLRALVARELGEPRFCLLEGRSMGGAVVTMLAERGCGRYDAAVACGAALNVDWAREGTRLEYSHRPRIPLLYVTNESEVGAIEAYIARVQAAVEGVVSDDVAVPALWHLSRPGHNRVAAEERLVAYRSAENWCRHGTFITRRRWDPTVPPRRRADGWARVAAVDVHGGFSLDLQPADLPVPVGGRFELQLPAAGPVGVYFGSYPFVHVPQGAWIAYEEPDGLLHVARNTFRFENAAKEAGVRLRDCVRFSSWDPPGVGRVAVPEGVAGLFG